MANTETRNTTQIDAGGKILGRLAVEVANILRGKNKASFKPNAIVGDNVVVFNTGQIKVTGKKMEQKTYIHHTLYPGGIKEKKLKTLFAEDPNEVLRRAVYNMLPKNKLRDVMILNLKMYPGEISVNKK